MAQIKYKSLISTESGVGASTGLETARYINENFKVTKENLEAIWDVLELMVGSPNIEGIRVRPVQDPDNPDEIAYRLFEYNLDGDFENGEWLPLQVLFENLVGDLFQNPQLKQALDNLTPLDRFLDVESQVGVNKSNISQNRADIEDLQVSDANQNTEIEALDQLTKQHENSLRTKANQVLELFTIAAKGSNYAVGDTILDQAGENILVVTAVDENGGILNVEISDAVTPNAYHISIDESGENYKVGDILATNDPTYNALVTSTDINGAILTVELTTNSATATAGTGAQLTLHQGSGALISMTTYPTLYFICTNDGLHNRIQYFLNGDLSTPYDIVAYPDFVNVQNIISSETDSYYEIFYYADSQYAIGYEIGDTFTIDGLEFSGQITDISTDPYIIECNIPLTYPENLAGTYTTTSTLGSGTGLHVVINSIFHPQRTTNDEFNTYMDNHDMYIQDLIENAVTEMARELKALIDLKADQADFEVHLNDFNNPHNVTKEQIGLDRVNNTSDMEKPISRATQQALNILNSKFDEIKKTAVVSTKYYKYLEETNMLDEDVLYNVGNYNKTYVTEVELDLSNATVPYVTGELLEINDTTWQLRILDVDSDPIVFSDNVADFAEFPIEGEYTTTSINGQGIGAIVRITSTEW